MINTKINEKIMEVFFEISRGIREKMSFDCNAAQLTVLQLQTLILISKNKTLTMGDIANNFKISLPTATVLSDKLVKMKLIKRNKNANDRRIVEVSLTEKGKTLLKKAMKQRHVKINELLSYLPLKDREMLFRILDNLSSKIKKTYEK
jgi:DNA-binding MarR family transcriptional regulator